MVTIKQPRCRVLAGFQLGLALVVLVGISSILPTQTALGSEPAAGGSQGLTSAKPPFGGSPVAPVSFRVSVPSTTPGQHWVATWSAAQVQPASTGRWATGFANQTLRQIVHTSLGGSQVRLQLSNMFGTDPVRVAAAWLGVSNKAASIVAGTNHAITVGQASSFVLPVRGQVLSDPVAVPVGAGTDLAVSLYFASPTGPATWHPVALTTSYVAAGNQTQVVGPDPYATAANSWYFLSGVDVLAPDTAKAIVAFGASTTDGEKSTTNADLRWVDDLNRRIDQTGSGAMLAILDQGIAGNRLLSNGGTRGPSGEARFAPDALDQPGVAAIFVSSIGIDDIGYGRGPEGRPVTAQDVIAGYRQLIAEAHAADVKIIGGTLTPDQGSVFYTPAREAVREKVNSWILTSGAFDATVNLAAAVADPDHPTQLRAGDDSGDHLHPNNAGYAAIADSINFSILDVA